MVNKRIFIYPKDLMLISGKSYSTCLRNISLIKDSISKKPWQNITIEEYASYEGIQADTVRALLQ